jgi:pimeloyl-ACP methyl ester carboxylesterase
LWILNVTTMFTVQKNRLFFAAVRRAVHQERTRSSMATPLHYEWIEATARTQHPPPPLQRPPTVFLHGLLGSGRNLKTMAKKICAQNNTPGLLVDLTGHGKSKGRALAAGPITFDDIVRDIQETVQTALEERELPCDRVTLVGHSLGGRLSLFYAHARKEPFADRVWLLDTVPVGGVNADVLHVLKTAADVQRELAGQNISRQELANKLYWPPHNLPLAKAQWLASSYKGGEFEFDLDVAADLIVDFDHIDFLDMLHATVERRETPVHLILGGQNAQWEESGSLPLIQQLAESHESHFTHHLLPEAGHWVHVDDLNGVLDAVASVHKHGR